jgi:hypothetical protein
MRARASTLQGDSQAGMAWRDDTPSAQRFIAPHAASPAAPSQGTHALPAGQHPQLTARGESFRSGRALPQLPSSLAVREAPVRPHRQRP